MFQGSPPDSRTWNRRFRLARVVQIRRDLQITCDWVRKGELPDEVRDPLNDVTGVVIDTDRVLRCSRQRVVLGSGRSIGWAVQGGLP